MERARKQPPLGENDIVTIGFVRNGLVATFNNETILAQGATRRKAYYTLMDETRHWPQAARDALYVMLYPHNIGLEDGEEDRSLGTNAKADGTLQPAR